MKKNILHGFLLGLSVVALSVGSAKATDYVAQGSGNWTDVEWSPAMTNPNDLISGNHTFTIPNTVTVTINDSANVLDFTVETGGTLVFGDAHDKNYTMIVNNKFSVAGVAKVSEDYRGVHTLLVRNLFTSTSGTINFRKGTGQAVNVVFEAEDAVEHTITVNEATNQTKFSNIEIAKGKFAAGSILVIAGSFSIGEEGTFYAKDKTIYLAGNFSKKSGNENFVRGSSTFVFNGNTVQSISNEGKLYFNNVIVNGLGFVVVSNTTHIYGDFIVHDKSTLSTSATLRFYGDFEVKAGGKYESNAEYTQFNAEKDQTIIMDGDVSFAGIYCSTSKVDSTTKTFKGSINSTAYVRALGTARIVDDASTYHHTFVGASAEGRISFSSPMTIKGGTLRKSENSSVNGTFSLGKGDITIQTGDIVVKAGDTFKFSGNITVESGGFYLQGTEEKQALLVGKETNTLTIKSGARFYIRGANDNYPQDCKVIIEEGSTTYYDSKFNQIVHGGEGVTYGHLYLDYCNKTFNGPTTILGHLYMYPMTGEESTVDFGEHTHTLGYHFYDSPDRKGKTSIKSSGKIILKSTGNNGQTIYKRTTGTYEFKDLIIENDDASNAQTKTIGGDITVKGKLELKNSYTNELLLLTLNMGDYTISGGNGLYENNIIVLGNNTCIRTSGANSFEAMTSSFGDVQLDANSTILFDGTKYDQMIPNVEYGNLFISGGTAKIIGSNMTIKGWVNQNGGSPKLTINDENVRLIVLGDWKIGAGNLNIDPNATIIFDGGKQEIVATTLPNVQISGSGVKKLKGDVTIQGNLEVHNGCEFDADNRTINLHGDFRNTDGGGGRFHQTGGRLNMRGSGYDQTITCASTVNTKFYNVYIEKSKTDMVVFKSDVVVGCNLMTTENKGGIDIENHTLTIGGDFDLRRYCQFSHDGAKLHFNGSEAEQSIKNLNTENTYPTMEFSGTAVKRFTDNAFDINGDIKINAGAIVSSGVKLYVSGTWENAGMFNSSSEVEFDGEMEDEDEFQLIGGSTFNNVTIGGKGWKRLGGIVNLTGWMKIDSLAKLDVSPDEGNTYYNMTIAGHWYNNIVSPGGENTGYFEPRQGTVTFVGNSTYLYTGDSLKADGSGTDGKKFYNVVINTSDPSNYKGLYPIHGDNARVRTKDNDLYVINDFTINTGIFYFYWNRMFVGGDIQNNGGTLSMNSHYEARNKLFLGGTGNKHIFDPGPANTIRQIEIVNGGTYNLTNSYLQYTATDKVQQDSLIYISNGTLKMKDCDITFYESGGIIIGENGTLHMDSAAVIEMYGSRKILNHGKLEMIGDANAPAKIKPASSDWTYSIIQEGATSSFEGDQFCIEGTRGYGLDLLGGTLVGMNNGTFSNSTGSALMRLTGIDLGEGLTADNITFNAKNSTPSKNVYRESGNGSITFTNYGGTLAGYENEVDMILDGEGEGHGPGLIIWSEPDGVYWTGSGDGISWHDDENWSNNKVPDNTKDVILNTKKATTHTTVNITKRAHVNSLVIDNGMTLNIVGADDAEKDGLEIDGKFTMMSGSSLSQADKNRDTLFLHGSWTCSGTYNHNHAPVVFDMATGSYQLTMNSDVKIGAMIVRSKADGALSLMGEIKVVDSIRYESGTLYGSNAKIYLEGDWVPAGGVFEEGESDVYLCSDSEEQFVHGGRFWKIIFKEGGKKTLTKDITVNRTLQIESNSGVVSAGFRNIYMAGRTTYWYNYATEEKFVHTGDGAVIFMGGSASIGYVKDGVAQTKPTIFNNLIIQGTSTKYIRDITKVSGSFEMMANTDVQIDRTGSVVGVGTGARAFTAYGGALVIYGRDNFPSNMNVELYDGTVYYRDSCQYQIVRGDISYNNIYLYNYFYTTYGYKKYSPKKLEGNITVKGTINIYDSITQFVTNGHSITLTGNLALAENGKQIDWGETGTITHVGGSWEVDADIKVLNNVYKKGTGNLNMNSNLTVKGDIEFDPETKLYMRSFKMTGKGDKSFKMGTNCQLHSAVVRVVDSDVALPTGFGTFDLDTTTYTYLEAAADQILPSNIVYGRVYLNNTASRTVYLNGPTYVKGNFYNNQDGTVLDDQGSHCLHLNGEANDLRNYRPTGTTVYLERKGDQRVYAGGGYTVLYLNNIELSGSGVKDIDETTIYIGGDITIGAGTSFSSDNVIEFSGDAITNNGTFRHYSNTFTFTGAKTHTISMGKNNIFNSFAVANDGRVDIIDNGISVNTGVFSLGKRAIVDMGEFTHNIASSTIDLGTDCNWITENANLVFNRGGGQTIPALRCRDIRFSTSGTKTLAGKLIADTLTIDEGVTLSAGSDASKSNSITVYGDWLCSGSFTSHNDTVYFESTEGDDRKIQSNGQWFSDVVFHHSTKLGKEVKSTFRLQDKMQLKNDMLIDTGAVVCLNKQTLVIGNDDTNLTDPPYYPEGEKITVEKGGELYIDDGGTLQFDHYDGYPRLDVKGTLTMVGSESANAVITRSTSKYDTHGTMITIYNEAKLAAEYYQVQYLAPTGFVIQNGAIIDDKKNLSNGIWSNMYTSYNYKNPFQADDNVKIDTLVYLTVNVDKMKNKISNIAFNHGGTPTVGHHFNIMRDTTLPESIELDTINGALGFIEFQRYHYINDNPTKPTIDRNIIWPPITQVIWTGLVSQDWFDRRNWFPMNVPDEHISARIPMTSNAPIIYKPNAVCDNLTITKGSLTIEETAKSEGKPALLIKGSVDVQDGGVFAVENSADIEVHGDWSIAQKGYFMPQNGEVVFAAPGGSVSVAPRKSDFNNVRFEGKATYMFMNSPININGDFTVNRGLVWPATSDYNYNIGGNYYIDAEHGGFNKDVVGFVNFVGEDQTIQNGQFNRVKFTNSGEKLIVDTLCATYNSSTRTARTIIVDGTAILKASAGCKFDIKGNVFVDSNASFIDGGETHTFTGYYWEGLGDYKGTGKILFNANHGQYIWGGDFHDIYMTLSTKYISGNVTMDGSLSIESCTLDMLTNQINGSGTFTMGEKTYVHARGANNYPSFSKYEITGTSCYSYYNGPMDQTIRKAKYGYLYLNSNTTKTLEGDITVLKDLYFYENGGTLVANNKNIYIGQHWKNQYTGTFVPGTGRVIFNGDSGNQYVYLGVSNENPFYDIEVDKPANQQFYGASVNLTLGGSLYVTGGKMNCVSGYRVKIAGNVTVSGSGIITQSGHYELNHGDGECTIRTNGSILNDLTLNGTDKSKFILSDDITVYGNFTLQKGTFDQNHHVATLGNSLDNIAIYGTYKVTDGGKLRIGDGSSFVVKNKGVFEALGSESNYAQITNNSGRYYFTVESGGLISANYYNFSFLAKQGIIISDGAKIDGVNNFSNGVFSNVVSGGVCLDIRNKQHMYGNDLEGKIKNISFPNNPGGGAVNIRKVESAEGNIEVYNATGLLAGALYENDPHGIIEWSGDVEYTWTGNASEEWGDENNWVAKLNGAVTGGKIPTADNNVIIPVTSAGSNRYPIITHDSAYAKRLTINTGAQLTINVSADEPTPIRCALYATSDVTINGTLTMTSDIDTLNVHGNWVIGKGGRFNPGEGTVVMEGVGVKTIQNGTMSFNNLVIDNIGTMQAQSAMKVGNNFTIKQGVFDVTSYDVTVGGSYVNSGTFVPQSKTLYLVGTAPLPAEGYYTFNPGSNSYYNVTVKGGIYAVEGNELFVSRNLEIEDGTLSVTSNALNIGDGTGVDNVNITGTLKLQNDGKLKMGDNAVINVNPLGTISMVGEVNHEAIVTSQNVSGTYSFNVNGTIAAKYYKVERVNASGVHLYASATIDGTNNLSHGQYISGMPGGRYIWFENNFGTDDTETIEIENVYFNAGPRYNASRDNDATDGIIAFVDAVGVAASYYYEQDDGKPNAGAILWRYTGTVLQWVGGHHMTIDDVEVDPDGTRWDNPDNWMNMADNTSGYPTDETELHIYPVDGDLYPVIYSDDRTADAKKHVKAKGITLYEGASLTLESGRRLQVENTKSGLIIGKNATFTAYDSVFIKGQFSNAGTFDHGNKSTVVWQSSLNRNIEMNGCPFYNFIVKNDVGTTVTFSVEQGKSLVIVNDFTVESGTVNCNGGVLEVGGDFTNEAGDFVHGNGTVKLNGASLQKLISKNGPLTFYNIELIGNGNKEIHNTISVVKTITVGSKVKAMDNVDIYCQGDWKRPQSSESNNDFTGSTNGYVIFNGNSVQNIGKPESFTNVEINNTSSASAVSTTYSQTIANDLKLTKGIFTTSNPVILKTTAEISTFGTKSYINGAVKKYKAAETDSVFFPIGGSDRYAPFAIGGVAGSTGTYEVSYHSETPSNRNNLQEGLNRVSDSEYWTLDCTDNATLPRATISWFNREFSGLKDFDVASVVLYTDSKWKRQGEMIKSLDLHTFVLNDSASGMITSRQFLEASGVITFGFSYPTLIWKKDAATNVYATKTNWSSDKYEVNDGVNILVDAEDADNYPTVTVDGMCYDLTIDTKGKLTVAADVEFVVWGDAVIRGTLELMPGARIIFMKSVDAANATVEASAGSTVVIGGSDKDQYWSLSSCYNLEISNADQLRTSTKTLTSNVTVDGEISIKSLSILTADEKDISLKGDFSIHSAGELAGTTNLILCGTGKQLLAITPNKPLYNLTINNTYKAEGESGIDLGTGIMVNGRLTFEKGILRSKSNARLSLGGTATTYGANNESYVVGEMEKKGKADFVFPIGSERRLAQIGMKSLSSQCSMVAEYVDEKPHDVKSLVEGTVEKVSWLEAWHLGNNDVSTNAYITLYWNDSQFSQINNPDELLVAAYVDGKWKGYGKREVDAEGTSGSVTSLEKINIYGQYQKPRASARQSVRRSLTSATPHTLAASGGVAVTLATMRPDINPLPIELFSFDATATPNNDVKLTWSTASERNNAYFTIEHTFNGETEMVADVEAKGVAGEGADYSYLHINQPAGTHYYRLHQTDFDGTTTVASDWVAVVIEDAEQLVLQASVAPNPGRSGDIRVSVSGISSGKFRYVVADMSGQTLIDRTVSTDGAASYQIDATDWNLQPSVYLIKVFTDKGHTVSKFIVE